MTDHNVKNLFDITDRSYVLGEQTIIAQGTSREILSPQKPSNIILVQTISKNVSKSFNVILKSKIKPFKKNNS